MSNCTIKWIDFVFVAPPGERSWSSAIATWSRPMEAFLTWISTTTCICLRRASVKSSSPSTTSSSSCWPNHRAKQQPQQQSQPQQPQTARNNEKKSKKCKNDDDDDNVFDKLLSSLLCFISLQLLNYWSNLFQLILNGRVDYIGMLWGGSFSASLFSLLNVGMELKVTLFRWRNCAECCVSVCLPVIVSPLGFFDILPWQILERFFEILIYGFYKDFEGFFEIFENFLWKDAWMILQFLNEF